jgi:TolB-like protein
MIAEVSVVAAEAGAGPAALADRAAALAEVESRTTSRRDRPPWVIVALLGVCAVLGLGAFIYERGSSAAVPPQSIAVLPFTDLTSQAMDEEYFADGMTEELIDRLSHIPGLRVPAATSSFSFKGKKLPVTDIGKALGVAYVLDGSVRESESTLRITTRLARVEDGYLVWSQSYDRPARDKLKVQEEIAREVAASLTFSK